MGLTNNYLPPVEAANYIKSTESTMRTWRCTGKHFIPYTRVGKKIFYKVEDLDAWLLSREVRTKYKDDPYPKEIVRGQASQKKTATNASAGSMAQSLDDDEEGEG